MLESPAPSGDRAVLEDLTGRRGRWMRRLGRTLTVLLLAWLIVLVGGGLGLTPVANLPLADALRPSKGPEPLAVLPKPRKPAPDDLRPARPLAASTAPRTETRELSAPALSSAPPAPEVRRARPSTRQSVLKRTARRSPPPLSRPGTAGRRRATPPVAAVVAPPGRSGTAPGRSSEAPGHSVVTPPGRSDVAPGQTATSPGRSDSALGRTKTTEVTTTTVTATTAATDTKPGANPPKRP